MKILTLINDLRGLSPEQTTTLLICKIGALQAEVHVAAVTALELQTDDTLTAWTVPVTERTPHAVCNALKANPKCTRTPLHTYDAIVLRTNPARDPQNAWAHSNALLLLDRLQDLHNTPIFNRPSGLMRASNKLYLSHIPAQYRPKTLVTYQRSSLLDFVRNAPGPCVLKPLQGTWGQDVFKVDASSTNLNQIIAVLTRSGLVCAQEYIPEAHLGDTRVLVLDGKPLESQGSYAAVRRVPGSGDFRSNIHAGGTPDRAVLTDHMLEACHAIGSQLRKDGIWFAGLDFIGHQVVEINTFSPGGLLDAERFYGLDFTQHVAEHLLQTLV